VKITDLEIEGIKLIELKAHHDARGFFIERFNFEIFKKQGLPTNFKQDNHSRSRPKVIRGLHFQHNEPQGKLVGVIRGKIWDLAVDLRQNSKTFGKYVSVELSEENQRVLWLPAGFAHGFCVLGESEADVLYKVDVPYNAKGEFGIKWNDSQLNIPWPIANPIVSEKDQVLASFADYKESSLANQSWWKK